MWVHRVILITVILICCSQDPAMSDKDPEQTPEDFDLKEVHLEYNDPIVRQIKILLRARGYKPGEINDEITEELQKVIKEFELASGMEQTGKPSFEVYTQLLKAQGLGAVKVPQFGTKDGCKVSFRYSKESEVLVIKEKCKGDATRAPMESDGVVAVPGMQIDYIPTPFGQ